MAVVGQDGHQSYYSLVRRAIDGDRKEYRYEVRHRFPFDMASGGPDASEACCRV